MQQPNPVEFIDNGDEIVFRMEEFDTVRVIHMTSETPDTSEIPDEDPAPTPLGHSTGRWEGNALIVTTGSTLVVTTDGINWPYFDQNGLRQSGDVETVERFAVNADGSRLNYEVVVTDPWLFTEPVTLNKSWRWIPGDAVLPFDCTEE